MNQGIEGKSSKRGKYTSWTGEEMAETGNFATVHGVAQTLREFKQKYPQLKMQPTSDFKEATKNSKKITGQLPNTLNNWKRSAFIHAPRLNEKNNYLRLKGAPVTASAINSTAKRVAIANDCSILIEHERYLSFNSDWGKYFLYRMEKEGKKVTRRYDQTSKIPVAF